MELQLNLFENYTTNNVVINEGLIAISFNTYVNNIWVDFITPDTIELIKTIKYKSINLKYHGTHNNTYPTGI